MHGLAPLRVFNSTMTTVSRNYSGTFMGIKNEIGASFVLELVPLRGENEFEPHPTSTFLIPFIGVPFKMSDNHPRHFYMVVFRGD